MRLSLEKLEIEKIEVDTLDKYIEFENAVRESMTKKEWLGNFDREAYEELLTKDSRIYIWKYAGDIVASGMLIPARQKDLDNFFSSDLDYSEVVDFGPQMVNPFYIGHGMQRIVISYLEDVARDLNYKYGITTVHPDNIYSINNFVKNGFEELGTVTLKRGDRKVFRKKI